MAEAASGTGTTATTTEVAAGRSVDADLGPAYRVVDKGDSENLYAVVEFFERHHRPQLRLKLLTFVEGQECVFRAADVATAMALRDAVGDSIGGIKLAPVEVPAPTSAGVLAGYPLNFPLSPLSSLPQVQHVERLAVRSRGQRQETRSVKVVFRGVRPEELDLGAWGLYKVRPFVKEPTRCFRCQRYGHVARYCRESSDTCGVCSERHPTSQCLQVLKGGGAETPTARCPNCREGHHAWFRRCPERLRRLGVVREGPERPSNYLPAPPPRHNAWEQRSRGMAEDLQRQETARPAAPENPSRRPTTGGARPKVGTREAVGRPREDARPSFPRPLPPRDELARDTRLQPRTMSEEEEVGDALAKLTDVLSEVSLPIAMECHQLISRILTLVGCFRHTTTSHTDDEN